MSDLARVQRSFSRSFASYDGDATLQARIARLLARQLLRSGAPQCFAQGFEIGCGTGQLSRALCDRFAFAALTLNDLGPEAARTADSLSATFLPGDARQIAWPERPDLIASASVLQWLEDPEALLGRAARALAPGGWVAVSSFGPLQFRELAALGSAAGAPGLRDARRLAASLAGIDGIEIVMMRDRPCRLWFESPHAVLRHLRRTGVNGRASGPWTKTHLARFCEQYTARFGSAWRVPLSYHPVWLIARKHAD